MDISIRHGHVLDKLQKIPDESIDCIITSPPYYGLRSYDGAESMWGGDKNCEHDWKIIKNRGQRFFGIETRFCNKCGAWHGQLGLEPTYQMYIDHLLLVTAELKRVLKKTGTMFWNMADSYVSDSGRLSDQEMNVPRKSQRMLPERFAIKLVDEQKWIKRNTLVWYKRNVMPFSGSDRYSNKWEPIFFFTKSAKYFFCLDDVRKPFENSSINRIMEAQIAEQLLNGKVANSSNGANKNMKTTLLNLKNKIMEQNNDSDTKFESKSAHNPYNLSIRLKKLKEEAKILFPNNRILQMKYMRSIHVDGKIYGANPGDVIEDGDVYSIFSDPTIINLFIEFLMANEPDLLSNTFMDIVTMSHNFQHFAIYPETLVEPFLKAGCPKHVCSKCGKHTCKCNAGFIPGTVLDPFAGSGTTGVVAKKLGLSAILIEAVEKYTDIIRERLEMDKETDAKFQDVAIPDEFEVDE